MGSYWTYLWQSLEDPVTAPPSEYNLLFEAAQGFPVVFAKTNQFPLPLPLDDVAHYLQILPPTHRVHPDVFVNFILPRRGLISRALRDKLAVQPMPQALHFSPGKGSLKKIMEEFPDTTAVQKAVEELPEGEEKVHWEDQVAFIHKLRDSKSNPTGLNMKQDELLGTHNSVFATLGFNNHGGSNGSVVIILSQDLLHHPTTTITPCAATSFLSRRAFHYQPWQLCHLKAYGFKEDRINRMMKAQTKKVEETAEIDFADIKEDVAIGCYLRSLLHPSQPGWARQAAAQLQWAAQLHHNRWGGKPKVGSQDILDYYINTNAHGVFEVHLPFQVSFDSIEKIFFPKANWTQEIEDQCYRAGILGKVEVVQDTTKVQADYFRTLFQKVDSIPKPPCGYCLTLAPGEVCWLPHQFQAPGKGTVTFTAKGDNIKLMFSDSKEVGPKDPLKQVYCICIGAAGNQETYFSRTVGEAEKKPLIRSAQHPKAMGAQDGWRSYWVTINQGDVRFGLGPDPTQGEIVEMRIREKEGIPFLYFSVSSCKEPIEFRSLCVLD